MHVISRKKLKDAAGKHEDLTGPLDVWFRIAKKASWTRLADVRRTLSSTDAVGKWTVFNIKGNRYRIVVEINYAFCRVYIRHILTHAEYARGGWKQ